MPKKIKVETFGPLSISETVMVPWEDVWLSWTEKPGRKKCSLAPTLISRQNFENEAQTNIELAAKYSDMDWSFELDFDKAAAESLSRNEIYIGPGPMPSVVTPANLINCNEAERMIAALMKQHGFKHIRCKWLRTNFFVLPI